MTKGIDDILSPVEGQLSVSDIQGMMMGGALVGLNLALMLFVGLYWTNPNFHLYISGRPL